MNIVVDKQPKCVATLRVEIPADQVQGQRIQIVRKYANKAHIQGFRPGKAPQALIEKRYQKEITQELNEILVNGAIDQALKQESLNVLNFGALDELKTLPDGGITFVSKMILAPEIQLPEYKGITVTVPPLAVPDEDITAQLKELQEHLAEFKDIEDRPTVMGDYAVIDYKTTVEGKSTEEFMGKPMATLSGQEGFWMRISEEAFLPGFAAELVGMNDGETKDIAITLPEDFPVPELRNKEMVFTTTLKGHKDAILPEIDDAMVARLFPGQSLAQISDTIRFNLGNERARQINDMKINQVVTHINNLVDFELPEELLAQETQSQADTIVRSGVKSGMTQEEIESQQTEIFTHASQLAVTSLRTNFILQNIAIAENITVNDKELSAHLTYMANSSKIAPKKFVADMQRAGRIPSVRTSMTIGKTLDFLVSQANVIESKETVISEA